MKKKVLFTISLCAAFIPSACAGFGGAAFADEPATFYPETFTASEITDFAVMGDVYAFAAEKKISVFCGDEKPEYYELSENVTALDCVGEVFYYKLSGSTVYSLPDNKVSEHKISQTVLPAVSGGYTYNLKDGKVYIGDGINTPVAVDGSFSNVKVFDGVVYAVNENRLNKLVPPESAEIIPFEVADFSATKKIPVGETLNLLKNYNLEKPHFSTLKDGEYITAVYPDELKATSDFLTVGNTFKVGDDDKFAAGQTALVLCKTGNADIIVLNGACYIKLADEAAATREPAAPEYVDATVCVPFDFAYSSPFVSAGTQLFEIKWGDEIKILGKISEPELKQDFYKISRADGDGGEAVGYVPCGFVVSGTGADGEHETKDPNYSESDMIKTVVLVILVVVLILAAGGYMAYIFTSGKRKPAAPQHAGQDES